MAAPNALPEYFEKNVKVAGWWTRTLRLLADLLLPQLVRFRRFVSFGNATIVLGFDEVQEVFSRHEDFKIINNNRADELGWDRGFLLARPDDDDAYRTMHAAARSIFTADHLAKLPSICERVFTNLIPAVEGKVEFDLVWDYLYPGCLNVVEEYYGLTFHNDDEKSRYVCALITLSSFFFQGKTPDDETVRNGKQAYKDCWEITLSAVRRSRLSPPPDTAIDAALKLPDPLNDEELTEQFLGMILGFIPTSGNAHGRMLDLWRRRPSAQAWADYYGKRVDEDPRARGEFLGVLREAVRMSYILPWLIREATTNTVIAPHTAHARSVCQGERLFISGQAAMHDPRRHDLPREFLPERSYHGYLHYGHGMHFCIGWRISDIVMTEFFLPLTPRTFELAGDARERAVRTVTLGDAGDWVWRGAYPWKIPATIVVKKVEE